MIRVVLSGFNGRMGTLIAKTVAAADDMELVGGADPLAATDAVEVDGVAVAPAFTDLAHALEETRPDVLVDFTTPSAVEGNLRCALALGIDCVVGTTGLAPERLEELAASAPAQTTLFHAPNFTLGAVLMMLFAEKAARYLPDAEVIEFHHNGKKDAPSGTAVATALRIAAARDEAQVQSGAPGKETESPGREGARGANVAGVPVHSVRSDGFFAHQEVVLGSAGETLTLRHDSFDRAAYMPGILLAIREAGRRSGLVIGLESLLDL
ncbi:MAG: 4-hydroxy-tetrahydrodipicolinate reductase [Coriobacteriales bacterium]|nr:4-hydroxy-tetrahydrodipicolinate reductase [Coriobacteriales bacterium]